MRTRIVIGAGAWLLGAAAATAGGLYVVSELGEGISASPASQQSSVAAAVQAQASQAAARLLLAGAAIPAQHGRQERNGRRRHGRVGARRAGRPAPAAPS